YPGGAARRLARQDAARAAVARSGRHARERTRRQPGGLPRRLPRRLCRAASRTAARAQAARRPAHRDRPRAHVTNVYPEPPGTTVLFARLVKFEHTIFALPFAYVGALLAVHGIPSAHDVLWVTVAMVGARSLAMALNRLIDVGIDAANPRTAGRELPSGALSIVAVVAFCAASLFVFLIATWQLAHVVRWLWPVPVVAFVVYPYLKRFTWLCHFWLGAVDGLAPIGAW